MTAREIQGVWFSNDLDFTCASDLSLRKITVLFNLEHTLLLEKSIYIKKLVPRFEGIFLE